MMFLVSGVANAQTAENFGFDSHPYIIEHRGSLEYFNSDMENNGGPLESVIANIYAPCYSDPIKFELKEIIDNGKFSSPPINFVSGVCGSITPPSSPVSGQNVFPLIVSIDQIIDSDITIFNSVVPAPLSYYKFDNNVNDDSGTNHGTVSGTASFVTGQKDQAFSFTGSNHITTNSAAFDFDIDVPMSVAFWVKTDVPSGLEMLIDKMTPSGSGAPGYGIFIDTYPKMVFEIGNSGSNRIAAYTTQNIYDNKWYHVVWIYDGTGDANGISLYIDGVAVTPTIQFNSQPSSAGTNGHSLNIGANSPWGLWRFTGLLDDVRIYDIELSEPQATTISDTRGLNSLVTISGITLTTPNTALTSGDTEALVNFKLTTTNGGSVVNFDSSGTVDVSGSAFTIDPEDVVVSTSLNPLDNTKSTLRVTVPASTTSPTTGSLGEISIPLLTDSAITNVVSNIDSPTTSSTLLQAKAQAYRYVLFAHSIGGASGQAELRGNDAVIALGEGFDNNVDDTIHPGSEGSLFQVEGTYMHELGHLLNLKHGGPTYLLSAPTTTLARADQNCVPIQRSVMSYTQQFPSYIPDWGLRFNIESGVTLNENTMVEANGVTRADGARLIYATPATNPPGYVNERFANGSPVDWNGDLDTLDTSPFTNGPTNTISNLAAFDVNNFGITGCKATPGQIHEIYNEPANFDFNFREGTNGSFDARFGDPANSKGQPEKRNIMFLEEKLFGGQFIVMPPLEIDGTDFVKAGKTIPLKFQYFETVTDPEAPLNFIDDATVEARLVESDGNGGVIITTLGTFSKPAVTGSNHYQFQWDTQKDFSGKTIGIHFVVLIPNAIAGEPPIERVLILPLAINDPPLLIEDTQVSVQVRFR